MRKIYIIAKDKPIEEARVEAEALSIGEIVHGVPPRLAKQGIKESDLPLAYEEPEIPPEKSILEVLEERIKKLEEKSTGKDE